MTDLQGIIEWTDEVGEACKQLLPDPSALNHLDEIIIGRIILETAFDEDCTPVIAAMKIIEAAGIELG